MESMRHAAGIPVEDEAPQCARSRRQRPLPHPVVQDPFGNEQVGNRCSVPSPRVMVTVLLEAERTVDNV